MLACARLSALGLLLALCRGRGEDGGDSCDNFTDLDLSHCFLGTSLYVRLLLYTRANPACGRELHHRRFPSEPLFNLSRPTAFVVHGYRPTGAPPVWIDRLVRLLAEGRDLNVVVVDWNRGAANLNYLAAVAYTREAAHNLTAFIRAMQDEGASLGSVHLIGVSLGAHLAGFVGANFVCDHQRSMLLYLCALNRTCSLTAYPCASYADFLDGRCLECEAFKPASCPQLGYDIIQWRESLLRLGQTKVFFSTTASQPYKKLNYKVDMVTWNQYLRWGVVYIRLHSGRNVTEVRVDHKLLRFEQFTSTRLLAQFDEDLPHVHKISLRINTGNVIGPRYKIRVLQIRLTPLERPERPPMCRFDIIMEENTEVAFRPLSCDSRP